MSPGASVAAELSSIPYVRVVEKEGAKRYFCSECKAEMGMYSMKRHVREKHEAIKEKCHVCNEEFKTLHQKKKHLLKSHNLQEIGKGDEKKLSERPTFFCDICKREYSYKKDFQIHMTNFHTLTKCPDCPAMFPAKDMLIHRNDVHGTSMPTCGICGYRNASEKRVLVHQRQVHLREKTVPCELCNLSFFNVRLLNKHLIRHKPDRIHECSFCHKKFPRKGTLRMHEKIHKGEKNKVCSICGERFVQKASLNYHMVKHHPEAC